MADCAVCVVTGGGASTFGFWDETPTVSGNFPCGSQYQSATLAITSQAKLIERIKVFSLRFRVLKAAGSGSTPVDSHWIGDVLDFAISERLVAADQLVLDLLVNPTRDIHLAGIGDAFET